MVARADGLAKAGVHALCEAYDELIEVVLAKISESGCKFSTLGILEISLSYKNVHELISNRQKSQ